MIRAIDRVGGTSGGEDGPGGGAVPPLTRPSAPV